MRITSGGELVIGGTSAAGTSKLTVNGFIWTGTGNSSGDAEIKFSNYASQTASNMISVRRDVGGANDDLKFLWFNSGGTFQGVAMQIDRSGRILAGTTATFGGANSVFNAAADCAGAQCFAANNTNTGATSQYVAEETGSPTLGMAAGIAAGIPFAMGAKGTLQAPTVQELKGQAGQQYKFAEDVGAVFKKNSYNQFANKIESTLAKEGLDKTF
jgi:hypothetical protein